MKHADKLRKGSAMVEFGMVFLALLATFGMIVDATLPLFTKVSLAHAVRSGASYAVTGQTEPGLDHDQSVKEAVKKNSLVAVDDSNITIQYYLPNGRGAAEHNDAGNIVEVRIAGHSVPTIFPIFWPKAARIVNARGLDVVEPFEAESRAP